ncbi:MAG: hypothetical protein AB7R55_09230 [Gemmatimonadales bacterium]
MGTDRKRNAVNTTATSDTVKHLLAEWIRAYHRRRRPVEVSFRRAVHLPHYPDRATHLLHPYPAKLLAHIPYIFSRADVLGRPATSVLDPFSGSGTVLLEGALAGVRVSGADPNPLSRLVTKVKLTPLPADVILDALSSVSRSARAYRFGDVPNADIIDYWYGAKACRGLARLRRAIMEREADDVRDALLVSFAVCARRLSRADPRLSVPVRVRYAKYPKGHPVRLQLFRHQRRVASADPIDTYTEITRLMARRIGALSDLGVKPRSLMHMSTDARDLATKYQHDLVITSPPYAGAQKYVRALSLGLAWLGWGGREELRVLQRATIGRDQYTKEEYLAIPETTVASANRLLEQVAKINPLRAHIAARYLVEMDQALMEVSKATSADAALVLVAGKNTVVGRPFNTPAYLRTIAETYGWELNLELVDRILGRALLTRRNGGASAIAEERVMLFRKVS